MNIVNNKDQTRFELERDGHTAQLVYRMNGNTMYIVHSEVPKELSGQGIASKLAVTALEYAKDNEHLVGVICPFVATYVKRHPEWYDIYDPKFKPKVL